MGSSLGPKPAGANIQSQIIKKHSLTQSWWFELHEVKLLCPAGVEEDNNGLIHFRSVDTFSRIILLYPYKTVQTGVIQVTGNTPKQIRSGTFLELAGNTREFLWFTRNHC